MGFYNSNTAEEKRVTKLTGDIHLNDAFKKECDRRGIPIYNAYNIQKRLLHEVSQEQLKGEKAVDERLMELLDERTINEVPHNYISQINARERLHKSIPKREEDSDDELLNKLFLQNQKIINQNKIIIEKLTSIEEKL